MTSTTIYPVRAATLRDARAIAEIHVSTTQAILAGILPPEQLRLITVEKRLTLWREAIEYSEPQVLVATQGEKVVGFVGFDRSRDPKTPPTTGEIWALHVAEPLWGQGVGLALWDAAREGLQEEGCTKVTVWVGLANERALRFHELAGFKRELPSARTTAIGGVRVEEIRLKRSIP